MTTTTANYYLSGFAETVTALPTTVDDLNQEDRCMVLYLIRAARRGTLSETATNIFEAQPTTIQDRVRQNVTVKLTEAGEN